MITTPLSTEAAEQLKKERASNMQDKREKLLQSITEALQELNTDALQLIDSLFIKPIKGSERYSINTPEERLEELKAASAKDKAYKEEQAAKQAERAALNAVPLYERNETMKLIGHSLYSAFAAPSGEYGGGFCDIIQAHKYACCYNSPVDIGLDFFIYGMICGIKEQRKRANKKK